MDKRIVVGVDPRLCRVEAHELETKRSHTPVRGVFNGVELGASDPQRGMGLLKGFWNDGTQGEFKEFALVFPAVVPEHGQRATDGVLPYVALVTKTQVKRMEFSDRSALT